MTNYSLLNFNWPHNRLFRVDGDEFKLQSDNYVKAFRGEALVHSYSVPKGKKWERRRRILDFIICSPRNYFNRVSFFCHGYPKKIDLGFDTKNVRQLARELKRVMRSDAHINLFCCRTGARHDDGFAALLSDFTKAPVLAHSTRGHTTRNPNKFIFYNGDVVPVPPIDKGRNQFIFYNGDVVPMPPIDKSRNLPDTAYLRMLDDQVTKILKGWGDVNRVLD